MLPSVASILKQNKKMGGGGTSFKSNVTLTLEISIVSVSNIKTIKEGGG